MKVLHPFLQHFRDEHTWILSLLAGLQKEDNWLGFFDFARDKVLESHEKCEELFLFPALAGKAEIRAGGPLCMLYYELHCQRSALERAAMICDEPRLNPRADPCENRKCFIQSGSPVSIPIEDHMAQEQIIRRALRPDLAEADREKLAAVYLDILKQHFEKEDNCLLPMAQSLLSPDELTQALERSSAWRKREPEAKHRT